VLISGETTVKSRLYTVWRHGLLFQNPVLLQRSWESAAEIIVGSVCSLISGPGDRFLTGRKQQERGLPNLNPCQASGVELAGVAAHIKVGQAHGVMSRQVIVI
jgi:hypothetical protein